MKKAFTLLLSLLSFVSLGDELRPTTELNDVPGTSTLREMFEAGGGDGSVTTNDLRDATNLLDRVKRDKTDLIVYTNGWSRFMWSSEDPNAQEGWVEAANAQADNQPYIYTDPEQPLIKYWVTPEIAGCSLASPGYYATDASVLHLEFAVNEPSYHTFSATATRRIVTVESDDRLATTNGVNAAIAESSVFIKIGGSEDNPPIRFSLNAPELMSFFDMRKTHLNHLTRISFDGSPEQIVFYDGTSASKDLLQILAGKANREDLDAKRGKTDLDIKLPSIESCTWGTPDTDLRDALIGVVPVFSNGKWSAVAGQWTSNLVPGTGYEESISFLFSGLRDDIPANATLVRGEPETVDKIAKKSEMTAGLAAKQSKITVSGILKGDGQGGVNEATKSSTSSDPANADYRDPQDNTCHKTEFGEWVANINIPDDVNAQPEYSETEHVWFWYRKSGRNPEDLFAVSEAATDNKDSELTFFKMEGSLPSGPTFTATRSSVCTDGKKFVTSDVVDGKVSSAVSTNNPAFVSAVRNTPTSGMPEDMPTDWGTYGTVGAALAALAAGLKWIKNILGSVASGYSTFAEWIASKYTKPSGGIPVSDLALTVQSSLDAADAAAPQATTYTKDETDAAIRAGASLGQMTNLGNGRYEYTGALADASTQTYPREEA